MNFPVIREGLESAWSRTEGWEQGIPAAGNGFVAIVTVVGSGLDLRWSREIRAIHKE